MNRDEIYMAALLHDIGKFVERQRNATVDKKTKDFYKNTIKGRNIGHSKHSAQFIQNYDILQENIQKQIYDAVLFHHEPQDFYQKIIQAADWLSSGERKESKNKTLYFKTPLQALFPVLFKEHAENYEKYSYHLSKLDWSMIFPKKNIIFDNKTYQMVVKSFSSELAMIINEEQLYYLLYKYLWSVPAQTYRQVPDISLFDHLKTSAAIALCLIDQYTAGSLKEEEMNKMKLFMKSQNSHFILINADLSGIQDFIFNISSKGAAKSLKGRSVYLSLLSEVVVKYILRKLDLKAANLLYSGGGNFYILAPASKAYLVEEARREILNILLKAHQGSLYFAIDYVYVAPEDFLDFTQVWTKVRDKIACLKRTKWKELGIEKHFSSIFGPMDSGTWDDNKQTGQCPICHIARSNRSFELIYDTNIADDEVEICTYCKSFIELTKEIRDAIFINIEELENFTDSVEIDNWKVLFNTLGFNITFSQDCVYDPNVHSYLLNSVDFLNESFCADGFYFGAFTLPMVDVNGEQRPVVFDELVDFCEGDKKLGYLKLDVDNLGLIFANGLKIPELKTISRVTNLSRMLGLYFEGYINYMIFEKGWSDKLYVVFSGGDDTFVVGPWNILFQFVKEFRNKFREFTCNNENPKENITFSASLEMFNAKYPIYRGVAIVDEGLDNAKSFFHQSDEKSIIPMKNKVSLFGYVFNWQEFNKISELKDILVKLIEKGDKGRSLLHRVMKSTIGFEKILQDSTRYNLNIVKFWRLAYYLRDVKNKKLADELIEQYRQIVVLNLQQTPVDQKIRNIMIIPAAIRWAEMETRSN